MFSSSIKYKKSKPNIGMKESNPLFLVHIIRPCKNLSCNKDFEKWVEIKVIKQKVTNKKNVIKLKKNK